MTDGDGDSGYDSLNRLTAASATSGPYAGLQASWNYDSFGNRTFENFSGDLISQSAPPIPASTWEQYNANNRVTSSSSGSAPTYDASGNVTQDDQNQYLYDAEGRVCASLNRLDGAMTGYLYDAEGNRVAKGPIATLSCDTSTNGFGTTGSDSLYILGPGGEQLTEMTWSGGVAQFGYTNVSAAGQLIASYTPNGSQVALSFQLRDWLGTLRAETDYAGNVQEKCESLPYGNGETCVTAPYLFTGKERDAESGNDYFGARYYGSSMGRFLSPDNGEDQDTEDPQSWNLYPYVRNNPLINTDPDGRDCVIQTRVDDNHETVQSQSGDCKNVQLQSGQSATYVNGTVDGWQAGSDGKSLDISYHNDAGNGVQNAGSAPAFDHPGIDGPANAAVFGRIGGEGMAGIKFFGEQMALNVAGGFAGHGVGLAVEAFAASRAGGVVAEILTKATSAVGNTSVNVASREVAEQAAKEWVGEGARPIIDRGTGKVVGEISADGSKVARFTSADSKGYINLVNRTTGSNLHVRW